MDTRQQHIGFARARSLRPVVWACVLVVAWLAAAPAAAPAAVAGGGAAIVAQAAQPPQNIDPPDSEGSLIVGATLTALPGTWTDDPTGYAYQWYSCDPDGNDACPDIAGATGQTYVLQPSDFGRFVGVAVVASNDAGDSDPAVSLPPRGPVEQASPPTIVTAPAIGGTAQQGQTLTATTGTWTGAPTGFTYQWYHCDATLMSCAPIGGATASTYGVAAAEVGLRIFVAVVATNRGGGSAPQLSAATAVVTAPAPAQVVPTLLKPATIVGHAQQGATLAIDPATWSDNPTSESQQWLRCNAAGGNCAPIAGATGETYRLVAADVGSRLAALVSAANAAGRSATASTAPSAVVLVALDVSVTRSTTRVRSDGSIALALRTKNPGTLTAAATASSASLAARLCVKRCPKARQVAYGTGRAVLRAPGTVTLVVKANAAARRAVAKYRRIRVRVTLTFKSSVGDGTNRRAFYVIVKKARPKHAR